METEEITLKIGEEEKTIVITERNGMAKQKIKLATLKDAKVDEKGKIISINGENLVEVENLEIKLAIKAYPLGATTYEKLLEQISGEDFDKLQAAIRKLNDVSETIKKSEGQ